MTIRQLRALVAIADNKTFGSADFTYFLDAMKAKKPIKRHPAGDDTTEKFGIIMPKSNDWSPVLAAFMKSQYIGGSSYKRSVEKHLGSSSLKFLSSIGN